jgi:hypothetical protein
MQNGELVAEPSARRLAAEAARVAGTKLVRGINTGIKVADCALSVSLEPLAKHWQVHVPLADCRGARCFMS